MSGLDRLLRELQKKKKFVDAVGTGSLRGVPEIVRPLLSSFSIALCTID